MRKNKQTWSVKTLVFLALLVAIQLVLSRVLVIDLGVYRITLGTVATVLAGLWMGPVAGGVEGAVADIIGCFMKGYGVNPQVLLSLRLKHLIHYCTSVRSRLHLQALQQLQQMQWQPASGSHDGIPFGLYEPQPLLRSSQQVKQRLR